jgi:hypothetical protein
MESGLICVICALRRAMDAMIQHPASSHDHRASSSERLIGQGRMLCPGRLTRGSGMMEAGTGSIQRRLPMRDVRAGCWIVVLAALASPLSAAAVEDPWVISTPVVITEPTEVGQIILVGNGSLTVADLPEPGLQVSGHIWAVGDSTVRFERSVIQFMSIFHGQYSLVGAEDSRIEVIDCDYRVPSGVQHALFAVERAEMVVTDTDFGDVQLISGHDSSFTAERLTGNFEVIVQDDSTMSLADIPRLPDEGSIWVWVEFPAGAEAEYTPPMPGPVESWSFPPPDATGIDQRVSVERCQTLLWPMLVREDSHVVLRDIPEDHWVVVGFHMPSGAVVKQLFNDTFYDDVTLDLPDRVFRVVNGSVDTWNFYPQADAHVTFLDSVVGEILSLESSRVFMERTTVDGTGGFLGARDDSRITARDCRFTCTIEASQRATIVLHGSTAEPYPADPTGQWTRFGAYDEARIFADQTPVLTTPALGDRGLIALSYVHEPPDAPPGAGESETLFGSIAQFSLDPDIASGRWLLEASGRDGGPPARIAAGEDNIEDGLLGTWNGANPAVDHRLRSVLTDGLGRTLVGTIVIPGTGPRVRGGE